MHTPGLTDLIVAAVSGAGFVALVGLVALATRLVGPATATRHKLPDNWTPNAGDRIRRALH